MPLPELTPKADSGWRMDLINDKFKLAVARLSEAVDPEGHEQSQWASTGGAILDMAANMTLQAFTEEGAFDPEIIEASSRQSRRIVITHAGRDERIAIINLYLTGDSIFVSVFPEPGRARRAGQDAIEIPANGLNEDALQTALASCIAQIQIDG